MFNVILISTLFIAQIHSSEIMQMDNSRLQQINEKLNNPATIRVTMKGIQLSSNTTTHALRGGCPQESVALTDSDFGAGAYFIQAGFEEGESLGAIYEIPEDQFPIRIDMMDVLFATSNAVEQTTTRWSVSIWDGTPTNGILVASYASDGKLLPHLVMPPGTTGTIISVSVDPDDPEQIYILNDSGTNSFTIAFKVEQHNSPGNPCISAPDPNRNAFPCTDVGGLHYPSHNIINAIDGLICVCGAGWFTFEQFPAICTPSGDWVMRAFYTPVNCGSEPAACCFTDNSCSELTPAECAAFGGTSGDEGSTCDSVSCGRGVGACCIESTGNCVEFDQASCEVVDGIYMGEGSSCDSITCFPTGACCLSNGNCIGPVTPEDCNTVGGTFQGNDSSCNTSNCPQPVGACCSSIWCLDLVEDDCAAVGGDWSGAGTQCKVNTGCSDCPEDINGDGDVNVTDLLIVVSDWGLTESPADIDGNGVVNTTDLLAVIDAWGPCE